MWNENPMKKYAREHPSCTLKEYCDYLDEVEQKRKEELKREQEEKQEILRSFTNKCFRLDFNGNCVLYFKITKDLTTLRESLKVDAYEVYEDQYSTSMRFESDRFINLSWLPGQDKYNSAVRSCNIIPEEVFNKIVENFEDMKKKVREMKEV